MDLQKMIDNMNEEMKNRSGREYNLGNLIDDLEEYKDSCLTVEFDDGTIPQSFDSWRGSYCELSLSFEVDTKPTYVRDLYKKAYNTNGSIFEGYKGGDFEMNRNTPIHQANYGEMYVHYPNESEDDDAVCRKVIGIKEVENKVIIITRIDED